MEDKFLENLLRQKKEEDWLEFKSEMKLYKSDGTLSEHKRDEFFKDILGLANGNPQIIRKTKYLFIGVDDKQFDQDGVRVLHNIDYRLPSQSEVNKWLNDICTPAISGLKCEKPEFRGVNLFVVTIPPTFDLHETTRDFVTASRFSRHTVFMRQDEHTVTASVRDGVAIQQLKYLFRHEVSNPSAIWLGILIGGLVSATFWDIGNKVPPPNLPDFIVKMIAFAFGGLFGAEIGWIVQNFNQSRYKFRYGTKLERISYISFLLLIFGIILFFFFR